MCVFWCSAGRYVRSNLNMPPSLPLWGGQRDYDMDAPITVFGSTQARLVGTSPILPLNDVLHLVLLHCILCMKCVCALPGEALLESNTVIDFVYCSPSLRCVQTAQNILKGKKSLLGKVSRIRDSPTFTNWSIHFMSANELYWYSNVMFWGCNAGLIRTMLICTFKMSSDGVRLCKQVCSRMVSWRCEWNRGYLNGPSGFLGTPFLPGYPPLTWLQPTSVWTQRTGDTNNSGQNTPCAINYIRRESLVTQMCLSSAKRLICFY